MMLDPLSVLLGYGNASPGDGMSYPRKRDINCISAKTNNMTHSNYCITEQLTLSWNRPDITSFGHTLPFSKFHHFLSITNPLQKMTFDERFSRLFSGQMTMHMKRHTQSMFFISHFASWSQNVRSQLLCQMADLHIPTGRTATMSNLI